MSTFELVLRLVSTLIIVSSGVLLSWRTLWLFSGSPSHTPRLIRYNMWIGSLYFWANVVFHTLFFSSLFRPVPVTLIAVLFLAWASSRPTIRSDIAVEVRDMRVWLRRLVGRKRLGWRWIVVATFVALCVRSLLIPPTGWDSLTYHGVRLAFWVQNAGFTYPEAPGTWNLFRNYFAGHEILGAWVAMSMRNDLFVGLVNAVDWAWMGLALWACARELKVQEPLANAISWLWMTPACVLAIMGSGYVEIGLAAASLSGLAGALAYQSKPKMAGIAVLAAMSAGVAAGMKLNGLLPAAFCGISVLITSLRHYPVKNAVITVSAALVSVLAPVLPFLVFNIIDTGAPLSPAPISVAGFDLGIASPSMKWFQIRGLERVGHNFKTEWDAFWLGIGTFEQPGPNINSIGVLWSLPLAPLGFFFVLWRNWRGALLAAAVFLGNLVFYFLPGMTIARILWPSEVSRYLLQTFLVGTIFSAALFQSLYRSSDRILNACFAVWVSFSCLRMASFGIARFEWYYLLICTTVLAVFFGVMREFLRSGWYRVAAVLGVLFFIWSGHEICVLRNNLRVQAYRMSYQYWPAPRPWTPALRFVDDGKTHKIAATSGEFQNLDNWWTYPFFGANFQNEICYIPITKSGKVQHFGFDLDRENSADFQSWMKRLIKHEVTEVISFNPTSIELDWMRAHPEWFRPLYATSDWGIFRVNKPKVALSKPEK